MIKHPATQKNIDTPELPWVSSPYSLFTWWDMDRISARRLHRIAYTIGQLNGILAATPIPKDAVAILPKIALQKFQKPLREIEKLCEELDMKVAASCAHDALADLRRLDVLTPNIMGNMLTELDNTIRREMQTVLLFYVPFQQAQVYEQGKMLFGQTVTDKFPTTVDDIEQASKCYAFGLPTACVFHLMRVMEVGTQRFGQMLGVDFPEDKEWGRIVNIASGKIKAETEIRPRRGHDPEIISWNDIHSHLTAVNSRRNQYMHPKATCGMDEAKDLISLVGSFMRTMAKRMPQTVLGSTTVQ